MPQHAPPNPTRILWLSIILILLVILTSIWSLSAGAVPISWSVIINTLFHLEGDKQEFIILQSRLPRTLLAILTGGVLALSGAIVQALLRNALASPKIIGINSGAAVAVCLGVFAGASYTWTPFIAVFGGFAAAAFVWLGSLRRTTSPAKLALIGVAVGFLCDAGVDYLLVTAPTYTFSSPLIWMTGSLWGKGWDDVNLAAPLLIPLAFISFVVSYRIDLIRLGDMHARGIGVNVKVERLFLLFIATALAAVSVAFVGALGFIGLMAPHIARQLVGGNHRVLLPIAMLTGMVLVVVADALGRSLAPPVEVSAGILTAILGAPFFIYILLTNRRGEI